MIKDILTDVTKITKGLKFDTIKVVGDDQKTEFKSMVDGGSVLMKGVSKKAIPEFAGTLGLGNLDILRGYLDIFNSYTDKDKVSIVVNETERNGVSTKTDITFKAVGQSSANYRLTAEAALKKVMVVNAMQWDVEMANVSRAKIQEFMRFASVLSAYSKTFKAVTENGKLFFVLGDGSSAVSEAKIEIGETTGKLNSAFSYPVAEVQTILSNNSPVINFSNKGLMMVKVDSGLAEYEFTFRGGN